VSPAAADVTAVVSRRHSRRAERDADPERHAGPPTRRPDAADARPSVPGTSVVPDRPPATDERPRLGRGRPRRSPCRTSSAATPREAVEVAMRAGVLPVIVGDRDARGRGSDRMQSAGAGSAVRTGAPVRSRSARARRRRWWTSRPSPA
jgi:hypothetical protein